VNLTAAAIIAQTITFAALVTAAIWYAAPWMKRHSLATALTAPLWIHALRQVAMQIFSARKFGFDVPLSLAREIAWGDVAGALLALTCLWLLRYRSRWARVVLWIFVVETVVDLVNATIQGIRNEVFTTANGVTWVILNFYVPLLWVTLALIAWRLISPDEVPESSIRADATLNAMNVNR
jgi:hypothetical protein